MIMLSVYLDGINVLCSLAVLLVGVDSTAD